MKTRVITGSFILLGLVCAIFLRYQTSYVFDVIFLAIATVACLEISKALKSNGKFTNTIFVALYPLILYMALFVGLLRGFPYYYFILLYPIVIAGIFIINLILSLSLTKQTKRQLEIVKIKMSYVEFALQKTGNSMFVLIYPAMLFVPLFFINNISRFNGVFFDFANTAGLNIFTLFMLFSLFITTMFTDTFAYAVGSLVKGPKLCPKISPKKTISGALGGLVFSLLGVLPLFLIFNSNTDFNAFFMSINGNIWHILVLGIIGSIITQIGDIYASYFKRKNNIKDFGSFLPGHGGALDRVDGLIFNGVLVFLLTMTMLL